MSQFGSAARLSHYRYALLRFRDLGHKTVYSQQIAAATGLTSAQVRKDFSIFRIPGNRRGGYSVDLLLGRISAILGLDQPNGFVLVGVGNLGRALLRYPGFHGGGIRILAGFDIDPAKQRVELGVPVLPLADLPGFVRDQRVEFGIIAVPDFAAQQVLDLMVGSGIKGILNFAPICLSSPAGCVVRNVNLATELEGLVFALRSRDRGG